MDTTKTEGFDPSSFMKQALRQAQKAYGLGEVPVGAIVVRHGIIVSRAYNARETAKDALGHAELSAIRKACKKLGGWRLWECELYVTLEPCVMCAGAIINSRIRHVYYGASDPKAGAFGSVLDINALPLNHHPAVTAGIMEDECSALLRDFFRRLRER